jgi:hypothetical protein
VQGLPAEIGGTAKTKPLATEGTEKTEGGYLPNSEK